MGYIKELRNIVGSRPLIMVGACVILINNKNELLLQLRKDNHCWGLSGGSMEIGETLEQVAKRELFEETGLTANNLMLLEVFSGQDLYYQYPHGDEIYNVVAAYICKDYKGIIKAEENEVADLKFFHINSIPSNISPPDLPIIREYIRSQMQE